MNSPGRQEPDPGSITPGRSRWPTGTRVFLILAGALFPLAVIALSATLQTARQVDRDQAERMQAAVTDAARALSIELVGDITALSVAAQALAENPDDAASCARIRGVFAAQSAQGAVFAILTRDGRLLCGTAIAGIGAPDPMVSGPEVRLTDNGLMLLASGMNGVRAVALYPRPMVAASARPQGFLSAFGTTLIHEDKTLQLEPLPRSGWLDRVDRVRAQLGLDGLRLELQMRGPAVTSALLIALLLPLLMWAAAAIIGWFVVDRLLIRPLRLVHAGVRAYRPGDVIDAAQFGTISSQELADLGSTFADISRTVQQHQTDLADGLSRQTKLTREVHHRVKNNLQVIASLINFHSRAAPVPAALEAYALIQRRVDALAVVHRHHFAELEDNQGLELRSVIGELASNLRATAPETASRMTIGIDIAPLLVSQDVAVAVAFLITELIELAMQATPSPAITISINPDEEQEGLAILRVSSNGLVDNAEFRELYDSRYGRVMTGLSRQLRATLHHDPLVGAYEIAIAARRRVNG
ncbi:sensor histidine kinase [Sphingomonas sp. BGYR3]|uniref:sensor histidine kinase n=1 Tax=Sphingomonas sp. BGYR3 TaxID=2975483 RepID=UPI0021A45604|nr:sensor histidine kinase [Sphingomonas sp. BGYR3]MDG5488127.1 sensor histidine kinase [Sphingomonas sp. BGYR3]